MDTFILNRAFFLPRLLGCFPYAIRGGGLVADYKLMLYSGALKSIFSLGAICSYLEVHLEEVDSFIGPGYQVLVCTISLVSYVCLLLKRDKVDLLQKRYAEANHRFIVLRMRPYSVICLWGDCILLTVPFAIILVSVWAGKATSWRQFYQQLCALYGVLSMVVSVQPFIRILDNLRMRFTKLRKKLISMRRRSSKKYIVREELIYLMQLFEVLRSTSVILNEIFSRQLLCVEFVIFFAISTRLYSFLLATSGGYTWLLFAASKIAFYMVACWILSAVCYETSKEVEEFNILLDFIIVSDTSGYIANNEILSLHVFMRKELVFTACGFFKLDYTLVHSMIAAATTYLVILIQFGEKTQGIGNFFHPESLQQAKKTALN